MEPFLPANDPGLLKASELFALDTQYTMPPGAKAQHDEVNAVLTQLIRGDAPAGRSAYERLRTVFAWSSALTQAYYAIDWMEETQLPQASNEILSLRAKDIADAKAAIDKCKNRLMMHPAVKGWLDEALAQSASLPEADQLNLALMKKAWLEEAGLDVSLVEALSHACTASRKSWKEARANNDFARWLPDLEKVVELTRAKAQAIGRELGVTPYQAMLNLYNPGLSNATVDELFGRLGRRLPQLLEEVMERQEHSPKPIPLPPVPCYIQRKVMARVMHEVVEKMGLGPDRLRLDESTHPFSNGNWDDLRVTTRYKESDMLPALMGVIHEAGHALYSHGLPREHKYQPVGGDAGMFIHESQSLFWEYQVANSPEFMQYLAPIITDELKKNGFAVDEKAWSAENLHRLCTMVKPSLIRVDADEVTYPAHVILRHDLEQKLIDGRLAPKDLPQAWKEGMKKLLGVDVPDDAHGCMQDIHWPAGMFGYFPAYTFGALGAAQLMQRLRKEMPDLPARIRTGDFAPLREWLADKIHSRGSLADGEKLMLDATRAPFSEKAWIEHVEQRYLGRTPGVTLH